MQSYKRAAFERKKRRERALFWPPARYAGHLQRWQFSVISDSDIPPNVWRHKNERKRWIHDDIHALPVINRKKGADL